MVDVVLVDEQDNVVGLKEKFAAHKLPVPLHRAISIVIFDLTGEKMMLQKRAENKPTWPLYWSNTCCTHPLPDESYLDCAHRRLIEEMGFDAQLVEKIRFIYKAEYDDVWGEHEYDVTFVGEYSGDANPNSEEAADWKWMKVTEVLSDVKTNPKIYTPWFKIILEKMYGVKSATRLE